MMAAFYTNALRQRGVMICNRACENLRRFRKYRVLSDIVQGHRFLFVALTWGTWLLDTSFPGLLLHFVAGSTGFERDSLLYDFTSPLDINTFLHAC
jgi:hypothetical protein